jgi:hypothetical protein
MKERLAEGLFGTEKDYENFEW